MGRAAFRTFVPAPVAVAASPVAAAAVAALRGTFLPFRALSAGRRTLFGAASYLVIVLAVLEKVRDIKECVPFETQVDERGLHAGQHACDAAFVDAAGERILVGALEVDFDELVFLEDRDTGFVPVGGDY